MWASNSNSEVNKNFKVDLGLAFQGLVTSGEFNVDIAGESQYKTFTQSMEKDLSFSGGDDSIAEYIVASPSAEGIYKVFLKWAATAKAYPKPTGFSTVPLWSLMFAAKDPVIRGYWQDFRNAYNHIVENPEVHRTAVRMTVSGSSGIFSLLTPSAYLEVDPNHSLPQDTVLTPTRLIYGGFPQVDLSIE